MRVEITSTDTTSRSGKRPDGSEWTIVEQMGWLHGVSHYPVSIKFNLARGQLAFAPGFYVVGPDCFVVGQYQSLGVQLNRMKPETKAKAA